MLIPLQGWQRGTLSRLLPLPISLERRRNKHCKVEIDDAAEIKILDGMTVDIGSSGLCVKRMIPLKTNSQYASLPRVLYAHVLRHR